MYLLFIEFGCDDEVLTERVGCCTDGAGWEGGGAPVDTLLFVGCCVFGIKVGCWWYSMSPDRTGTLFAWLPR